MIENATAILDDAMTVDTAKAIVGNATQLIVQ